MTINCNLFRRVHDPKQGGLTPKNNLDVSAGTLRKRGKGADSYASNKKFGLHFGASIEPSLKGIGSISNCHQTRQSKSLITTI
jgi:hypothetical protein